MISSRLFQFQVAPSNPPRYSVKSRNTKIVFAQSVLTGESTTQFKFQTPKTKQELSEVKIKEEKPGFLDSKYFAEDKNVEFWRNFHFAPSVDGPNVDTPKGLNKLGEALIQALVSAQVFQDETSLRYWTYHIARTAFFLALGVASLVINQNKNSNKIQSQNTQNRIGGTEHNVNTSMRLIFFGPPAEAMVSYNQDLRNIKQGLYKLPWDMTTLQHHQYNPQFVVQTSVQYVQDAVQVLGRSRNSEQKPLWLKKTNIYPEYYQNTFHYQTDGWMSSESANIYETQTETIFSGRQDVMQRHTLIPIPNYVKNKSQKNMRALEVAAGTGRFATFFKDNYPDIHLTISDLSPYYLEQARKNMKEWKNLSNNLDAGVDFIQAAAENLPFEDNCFDIVYCVYLFHEIPYEVRVKAIKEFSRVLCPGGILVVTDSYQLGDRLGFDKTMQHFQDFNEPWYGSYIKTNFGAIFEEAGLLCDQKIVCSVSKTLSAIKPKN